MNRRVRNRTPGGVGGGRRKAPSYPILANRHLVDAVEITADRLGLLSEKFVGCAKSL